jgi:hypothetical protein
VIHYHGTPFPEAVWQQVIRGRHCLISFRDKRSIDDAAKYCQSFVLDNGAFSAWRSGKLITNWVPYYKWVEEWSSHPGFDWAAIPDVIGGTEDENRGLVAFALNKYGPFAQNFLVPVWHPHESFVWAESLAHDFRTIAIGGSDKYPLGTKRWWKQIDQLFKSICNEKTKRPICRVHGMRMLDPDVFTRLPLASADSVNGSRNLNRVTTQRTARYKTAVQRARGIIERVEAYNSADRYAPLRVINGHLFGGKDDRRTAAAP